MLLSSGVRPAQSNSSTLYATVLLFQSIFQSANGVLLHSRQYMAVSVQGDSYGGVTEHLGDDLWVDVAGE